MKRRVQIVLVAVLAVGLSGCLYFPSTVRTQAFAGATPWWCTSAANGALSEQDCRTLSAQLDVALAVAHAHPVGGDALAAGATVTAYATGVGAGFELSGPTEAFDPAAPDTLLYDADAADAQIAGVEWNVAATSAPEGFAGANDVWTETDTDVWTLRAWIVRPFQSQPEVFAATHPCLEAGGPVYDVTATCYTDTHTEPIKILVTNDDGYAAPGIDAVVEGLRVLPNVEVTVVAPATNQSGSGDKTTPGGVTATAQVTASGYPATAVNGFPADSVLHALRVMGVNPDLVVSGINSGQNMGPVIPLSGTVGAARTGARNGIPAVAASSGLRSGVEPDFASGAAAVLAWYDDFLLGRAGPPTEAVANLNIPTCADGSSIRGTVTVPVATSMAGRPYGPSDCTSTSTAIVDDVDGFNNGFITLSDAGVG
ncbi:MAG: 5'/3'-nucleotidase SurE [Acidimicrobiales bacterium]|nr:5'/3'-nucleotidase SurE [Acidimicrobiales bacterium]